MSVDEYPKYLGLNGGALRYAVSAVLTFGFVLVGYDQGVMSGVITQSSWLATFPAVDGNATLLGFTVAIYDIGCLLGALFCMIAGDYLGRKRACMFGGVCVVLGVVIQIATFNDGHTSVDGTFAQFLIGRTLTGFGNGVNMATMPILQAELSDASRGKLVCLETGLIATGTMLSYWLNYGVRNYESSFTWRFPIGFQVVLCSVYTIGVFWVPESPRWLCKAERVEEATRVMAAVNGESTQSPRTKDDVRGVLDSIALENAVGKTFQYRDLFTGGPSQNFRRLVLGVSSQFFQQWGGCNAVIYYLPILLMSSLNKTGEEALLLGGANQVIYAAFSLTSFFTVDRVGRRKLFLIGALGQGLSMVLTFGTLIPGTAGAAKAAVAGLFLYIAFFGSTYLTVPWLYAAEINPLRTRAKGAAAANIVNWSSNFVVVLITPILVTQIGWGTYVLFAALNLIFVPFIYFFYPETGKHSLEEIDLIFAKGYMEKMSYVRAAKELPKLTVSEMERLAVEYGLTDEVQLKRHGAIPSEKGVSSEHLETYDV